jgi:hypothetical protein
MEKRPFDSRQEYVSPAIWICPAQTESCLLTSPTIPEYKETEEDW